MKKDEIRLICKFVNFVIMFVVELLYIDSIPAFVAEGGFWMYAMSVGTILSIICTICLAMHFITSLWEVMDWEDWGL